jgi:hypothetical protein
VFNKAVIHGPFTPVLAQNSPTRLHEDPLLLTRVPDGTRQHHPFYQPLCRFFTIAKFAVTPEDTENMGISPSGFSRERGALEFLSGMREQTENGEKDFVENAWIGKVLAIGDTVRLSITGPCPRCVMTTLPQGDLPKDVGILRAAAQHNQANVGVYASVLQGGKVRRGDSVSLE